MEKKPLVNTQDDQKLHKIMHLNKNVRAQIMMTDTPEDALLLGFVFIEAAKNIFTSVHGKEKSINFLRSYIEDLAKKLEKTKERKAPVIPTLPPKPLKSLES